MMSAPPLMQHSPKPEKRRQAPRYPLAQRNRNHGLAFSKMVGPLLFQS
jgi:hypothetical protein